MDLLLQGELKWDLLQEREKGAEQKWMEYDPTHVQRIENLKSFSDLMETSLSMHGKGLIWGAFSVQN